MPPPPHPSDRPTTATVLARATAGTVENRRDIHAYVSPEAHAAWAAFAAEHKVTISALIEALAGELELDMSPSGAVMAARLDAAARVARRIDTARRRRGRR